MSINIGFKNDAYSLDEFQTSDSRLFVNTYNQSNVISLNTDYGTNENAMINYKNRFLTGVTSNIFHIFNLQNNKSIIEINSNFLCKSDISIKDLYATTSNTNVFTSNFVINFRHASLDKFRIYNNNNVILETSPDATTINNVKVQDTIYANKIVNYTGSRIEIQNPTLIGLTLESFTTEQSINVNNVFSKFYSNPTLLINRYDNLQNFVELGTCNIYKQYINKHFILNRHGMLGIGPNPPDAPLSINVTYPYNPYIFKYQGSNHGDKLNFGVRGNIGIGTAEPKGLIHIHRDDDLKDEFIRKDPLIKLDILYNSNNNIVSTSNVYNYITKDNFMIFPTKRRQDNIFGDIVIYNIYNIPWITNSDAYPYISNVKYSSNQIVLRNNNTVFKNFNSFVTNNNYYTQANTLIYPNTFIAYERTGDHLYSYTDSFKFELFENLVDDTTTPATVYTSNTCNFIKSHYFTHTLVLMSKDTYDVSGYVTDITNPRYNANKFTTIYGYYSNIDEMQFTSTSISTRITSNCIHNAYYTMKMYIENTPLNYDYTFPIQMITYDPPFFMYMTSNTDFKFGLSSAGTLSLGSLDTSNKFLLHVDGDCMLKKSVMNEVYTSNTSLNFNNINISNINEISATSNIVNYALIQNSIISNIYVHSGVSSNMYVSNLIINAMNSGFIIMNSNNIHVTTQMSYAKDNTNIETNINALAKMTVHSALTYRNPYYKHLSALIITNETNTAGALLHDRKQPSISIVGYDESIPYMNLSRQNTDYFIRVNNKSYAFGQSQNSDIFELCCDTLSSLDSVKNYYSGVKQQPSFLNHIKNFNLLTFGEINNVCISCSNLYSAQASTTSINNTSFTNGTNKIALGLPYGLAETNSFTWQDWPQFFNNNMCKMVSTVDNTYGPFMLNVFGNASFASVHGKNIMSLRVDDGLTRSSVSESVRVVIGTISDVNINNFANLLVHGNVNARDFIKDSDSNIKKDLHLIEHALNKVNSISGYTFTNVQSSTRETGLVAQEVYHVLPEVVHKNPETNLLGISYGNMAGLLVESIKELDKKMTNITDKLMTRMTDLEQKVNLLTDIVSK
jgi:hypothetical protein